MGKKITKFVKLMFKLMFQINDVSGSTMLHLLGLVLRRNAVLYLDSHHYF